MKNPRKLTRNQRKNKKKLNQQMRMKKLLALDIWVGKSMKIRIKIKMEKKIIGKKLQELEKEKKDE